MSTHEEYNTPNYNYSKDKPIADLCERQVSDLICSITKCKLVAIGKDNKWDLKFEKAGKHTTVEVKEDFTCARTGNVGLEFSCRGKDSGISVSKSDFYCYKIHEPNDTTGFYLIPTNKLKDLIEDKAYFMVVNGGDLNSDSLNYLFKLNIIKSVATKIGVM